MFSSKLSHARPVLSSGVGVDVVVDSSTLSTSGGTRIAFFQDVDVAVRIPNAFAAIKDITV